MEFKIQLKGEKKVETLLNGNLIKTDQPVQYGGGGSAPAPFDLFLASIGTCAGFYIQNFCQSRGIPFENIEIIQKMKYNPENKLTEKIELEIQLPDDFPQKYRAAVIKAADLCAVKRHLNSPPDISVYTTEVGRNQEIISDQP